MLLIDDLQWCDPGAFSVVALFAALRSKARILVIGTVRAEEPQHQPLRALLVHLRATTDVTEINLGPLDAAETAKLAAQVAGLPAPMPVAAVMRLFTRPGDAAVRGRA
ncbi:MAG: hypothetical protein U0232_23155 [Thermomicrobiales bacterium]